RAFRSLPPARPHSEDRAPRRRRADDHSGLPGEEPASRRVAAVPGLRSVRADALRDRDVRPADAERRGDRLRRAESARVARRDDGARGDAGDPVAPDRALPVPPADLVRVSRVTAGVKLAIMQPYLFPYIGYFQLMHAVDRFVVADDLTFIKQGWINRNRLLINGRPAYFTVPLKRHASDALIRDVEIDGGHGRARAATSAKTIANFYRRAPSFEAAFPMVERVIGGPFTRIADMARASLHEVCEYLGIRTAIVESSAQYGNAHLKGQDRVIDTCLAEKATDYVN